MYKNNFFILSGAMGGGKSAILELLKEKKFKCVNESARQIIKEQRNINGDGVYDKNPDLFAQLMLSRSINNYEINSETETTVIFDRGIPDMVAYAELFNINKDLYMNASKIYLYNKNVFIFRGWKDIYTNDDERKMGFETSEKFGENVIEIYKSMGYNVIEVPFVSIEERVDFIISTIKEFEKLYL